MNKINKFILFLISLLIILIPNISLSQTNISSIFEDVTTRTGSDVDIDTYKGGSTSDTADINVGGGVSGELGVDASCDNIEFNFDMQNYMSKLDEMQGQVMQAFDIMKANEKINLAVAPVAFVMCQLHMDAYENFESFQEAISGAVETATQMIQGLTGFLENTEMGGSPTLNRNLISKPKLPIGNIAKNRKKGETASKKAESLSECMARQTAEIRKIVDEMANRNFSFNLSTHMNFKEECILDKTYKTHDLGGALSDLLETSSNVKGYTSGIYCFIDGTCAESSGGVPEIKNKMPYGLTYPTKTEYQEIVKKSMITWLNKSETMNINPFAYLVVANKLNNLLNDKYDRDNLNVYENDFLIDLQNAIKYSINSSMACIKSEFILFQPKGEDNYKLQLVDKTINCLNKNFFTDGTFYIDKTKLVEAYKYLNSKKLAGEIYNINQFTNVPEQGMTVSDAAKNLSSIELSEEYIYYDLYNNYIAPIYVSIRSYGASYKPHAYKLLRDIGNSLFIVYDDFYGELERLQAEKMVTASHNMNRKILSVAQRENLGLEKQELISRLLEQKYYDNLQVEKTYYTGKY